MTLLRKPGAEPVGITGCVDHPEVLDAAHSQAGVECGPDGTVQTDTPLILSGILSNPAFSREGER